jgi:hypothetical protein
MKGLQLRNSFVFSLTFFPSSSLFVDQQHTQGGHVGKKWILMQRGGKIQNYGNSLSKLHHKLEMTNFLPHFAVQERCVGLS